MLAFFIYTNFLFALQFSTSLDEPKTAGLIHIYILYNVYMS